MATPATPGISDSTPPAQPLSYSGPRHSQGGAPGAQEQATKLQMLLADWFRVSREMAVHDRRLAAGMEKVAQGIQEAQAALVTPSQPTPIAQQPQY